MNKTDVAVTGIDVQATAVAADEMTKSVIAGFEGEVPEITVEQWGALLAERDRLGRPLSDNEAREVIRRGR